jgi:hypothetical protein
MPGNSFILDGLPGQTGNILMANPGAKPSLGLIGGHNTELFDYAK